MNPPKILQNALYFPAHDFYLPSKNTHDYRVFEYLPGHQACVDGGPSYIRRSVTPPEHAHLVVPFDLTTESTFAEICDKLLWGSLPLDKTKPQVHVYRPLSKLTPDHLKAIWDNCPYASPLVKSVIRHLLGADRDQTPL